MENTPYLYDTLVRVLSQHANGLDRRHLTTLAWMMGGLINSYAMSLVPHPLLILGYSRSNFVRASSILNCQSTLRCLALVLSAQIPISDWSKGSSPMRRSVRH